MSEKKQDESTVSSDQAGTSGQAGQSSTGSGPTFTESPDPLAGVKKSATSILDSMEGKSVSMKTYVGSIIAVVVLMLLARCGG